MTTRRGLIQSLLLATILAAGAGIAWIAAGGISYWVVDALFPERYETRESLDIIDNGEPAIRSSDGALLDLNRKPFLGSPLYNSTLLLQAPIPPDIRMDWWSRCKPLNIGSKSLAWFFVHDGAIAGHGYFVGYNVETNLPVQYIGRNGLRTQKPSREEQFPVSDAKMSYGRACVGTLIDSRPVGNNGHRVWEWELQLLSSDEGLVAIDLARGTVKFLWKGSDLVSTAVTDKDPMAAEKELHHTLKQSSPLILVRTSDQVIGVDSDGREQERYIIPPELRNDDLEWHRLADGRVLVPRYWPNNNELFWIDATSKIVRHEQVNLRVTTEAYRPWPVRIMRFAGETFYMPSPGTIVGSIACYPWNDVPNGVGYFATLWKAFCKEWQALLANFVLSVILAIFCFRHQRKNGLPWTWAWVTFTLIFGLLGFVGYMTHRVWPVRLLCPHCNRQVPRDRSACFACGREFPTPETKGIEVFA